ncbi:ArsR/SmtB family transcription factor [Pseudomonas sp. GM50]|uniref:ArsR/SmtB family transcription factor n=1 Tax=Pseudomonas sp. GM50 TaxID=1144332 RepID=UPI001EE64B30|nr:helix-turn-helix transcriptional regulator [Pseudomonas sp. GM50]
MQIAFNTSFQAIAHPLRRKILEWLKDPRLYFPNQEYGHDLGVCAGQITQRCGLPQSTVSSHLAVLKKAHFLDLQIVGPAHFLRRNEEEIERFKACIANQLLP